MVTNGMYKIKIQVIVLQIEMTPKIGNNSVKEKVQIISDGT